MESAFAWLGNIHGGGLGRKGHGDGGDRFACGTSHVDSVEEILCRSPNESGRLLSGQGCDGLVPRRKLTDSV